MRNPGFRPSRRKFLAKRTHRISGPLLAGALLTLPGFGWRTLAEMGVFIGVLAVGLAHAWRRGVLRWV